MFFSILGSDWLYFGVVISRVLVVVMVFFSVLMFISLLDLMFLLNSGMVFRLL